jgi:hypothetical protein
VEPAKGGALAGTGNSSASCRGRYGDFAAGTTGGEEEVKWIMPEKFFDVLPMVLAEAAPMPGEEARYAQAPSQLLSP